MVTPEGQGEQPVSGAQSAPPPPDVLGEPATAPAPTREPTITKYSIPEAREQTRATLAGGLAVLLGIVGLLLMILTAAGSLTLGEAKDLAEVIFSPIVVLTGTALGFYFGVHQDGR